MATLDLSDAQKEKVKAIFASHKEQFQAFRTQAKANREALKAAASAENPDPAVVGAAFLKVRADGKAMKAQREGRARRDQRASSRRSRRRSSTAGSPPTASSAAPRCARSAARRR